MTDHGGSGTIRSIIIHATLNTSSYATKTMGRDSLDQCQQIQSIGFERLGAIETLI